LYKSLLTPNGIFSTTSQSLGFSIFNKGNLAQVTFSPDGTKLIYSTYDNPVDRNCSVLIMDFDRCTSDITNVHTVFVSSGTYLWGLAFSPSGELAYACNSGFIFQINTTSLLIDTVAVFDGFISGAPPNCCATSFWEMYLAANGKIYITSGSSAMHIHEMNYPDSSGVACDVQQHAVSLGVWNFRSVPNHPNYYLGAADGTICDSLGLNSVNNLDDLNKNFRVSPNPNNGNFSISYLLPQGKAGRFDVFDINGKIIYSKNLPPWSTSQSVNLPTNVAEGIYSCVITSSSEKIFKKIIILKDDK